MEKSDKLDPNKVIGLFNTKHQNYESNFYSNLIAPSHCSPLNPMIHQRRYKDLNTGSNEDKDTFIFHPFTETPAQTLLS